MTTDDMELARLLQRMDLNWKEWAELKKELDSLEPWWKMFPSKAKRIKQIKQRIAELDERDKRLMKSLHSIVDIKLENERKEDDGEVPRLSSSRT